MAGVLEEAAPEGKLPVTGCSNGSLLELDKPLLCRGGRGSPSERQ